MYLLNSKAVAAGLLLLSTVYALPSTNLLLCATHSQPNPIKNEYPNEVTGLLNATLAIIPIPLKEARRMVPHKILESAYQQLMPSFPKDMYPVVAQAALDHDIHYSSFSVPDFSRVGYEFPFLDLLSDGYSNFRWAPTQFITYTNLVAVEGSEAYGTTVYPGKFTPQCDAYGSPKETYFLARSLEKHMSLNFQPYNDNKGSALLLNFFKNVTNQPSFANGSTCDQQIRFFNTSVTQPPFSPTVVRGDVSSNVGPFGRKTNFKGVEGLQVASAFIEKNYIDCSTLKGL